MRFRMETLQREGRVLFGDSAWGGTADISSAYHHIPMHDDSTRFLSFEWEGQHYFFAVLPIWLSIAPWIFTTVMACTIRFLRFKRVMLMVYLDDVIFAAIIRLSALMDVQHECSSCCTSSPCSGGWCTSHQVPAGGSCHPELYCLGHDCMIGISVVLYPTRQGGPGPLGRLRPVDCGPLVVCWSLARFKGLISAT
jgi:hypothetical protein